MIRGPQTMPSTRLQQMLARNTYYMLPDISVSDSMHVYLYIPSVPNKFHPVLGLEKNH